MLKHQIPNIIKEDSNGFLKYTLEEEFFMRREIVCGGELTEEYARSIVLQLLYLQTLEPETEITMYISSPGGEISGGLAIYDAMRAGTCPIRTVCVGSACSMAAILFLSGNMRCMLPHARLMIHDPLIHGGMGGNALQIRRMSDDLMRSREILAGIIASATGRSLEEVYEKTAIDSYFNAEESVAWGLADTILTKW